MRHYGIVLENTCMTHLTLCRWTPVADPWRPYPIPAPPVTDTWGRPNRHVITPCRPNSPRSQHVLLLLALWCDMGLECVSREKEAIRCMTMLTSHTTT